MKKNKQNGRTVWLTDGRVENIIRISTITCHMEFTMFHFMILGILCSQRFPSQGVVLESILLYMGTSPGPNLTTRRQCFPHPHFIRTYTALQHSHPNRRPSGCYDIIPSVNHLIRFNIIECKQLPRWECASLRKEWVHMVIVLAT